MDSPKENKDSPTRSPKENIDSPTSSKKNKDSPTRSPKGNKNSPTRSPSSPVQGVAGSSKHRWRRRSNIVTIGEKPEDGDHDDCHELESDDDLDPSRRRGSLSSNSSFESDTELAWELLERRRQRRESIAPMHPGLQLWVDSGYMEEQYRRARKSSIVEQGGKRKKLEYDEVKAILINGKVKEGKLVIREAEWGLNHEIRSRLWPLLASVHETSSVVADGFYWESVEQVFGSRELTEDCIRLPSFGDRRYKIYYGLSPEGRKTCDRIAAIIGFCFPDITYCPLLLPVTALLLHYAPEEKTYNNISILLSAKHKVFFTQTRIQWEVTSLTAMQLTKKFAKASFNFMKKNLKEEETMEMVFADWLLWIFKDLPLTHVVRILDCFLMEGIKVLYRLTIAVLQSFSKIASVDSKWSDHMEQYGLESAISRFCRDINENVSSRRLLKTAFSIRAFRGSDIRRIYTKIEFSHKSRGELHAGRLDRSRSNDNLPIIQMGAQALSRSLSIRERNSPEEEAASYMLAHLVSNIHIERPDLIKLWQWLPLRISMNKPKLLYTTLEHGSSLTTFFNRVENNEFTLIIIKTTKEEIFGAFCSVPWSTRNTKDDSGNRVLYFGTGETFLYSILPMRTKFYWVGHEKKLEIQRLLNLQQEVPEHLFKNEPGSDLYMLSNDNSIQIGGGDGTGLYLDEDLRFGKSETCKTFNNPPLVEGGSFEIKILEVIGFEGML